MNRESNLITAARFTELVADTEEFNRLRHTPTNVMHDVCINGKEIKQTKAKGQGLSIHLENFTFLGRLRIENVGSLMFTASSSHFLAGLDFSNCAGNWMSIRGCSMESFGGFRNRFKVLSLEEIEGPPADRPERQRHPVIKISGFTLSEKLVLNKVQAKELQLTCHTEALFSAPAAKVDDPLWALQLQLAGVKVFVETDVAKKMLERGSYSERLRAAGA